MKDLKLSKNITKAKFFENVSRSLSDIDVQSMKMTPY